MKKIIALFTFSFLFIGLSFSQTKIKPSGNVITKDYSVADFHKINISSDFTAKVTIGGAIEVKVDVDDNMQEYVFVESKNDMLTVMQKSPSGNFWVQGKETLIAHITVPSLDYIKASEDAIVILETKLVADNLTVELEEDSTLDGELIVSSLDVNLDEDSYLTVSGKADRMTAVLTEDSEMRNMKFEVGGLDVKLEEDSIMKITVNGKLNARLNGDSEMVYRGNPTSVNQVVRGDSEIERIRG